MDACPPTRAQAWLDRHEEELLGIATDDAITRIEGAGLHARVVAPTGGWLTQELRSDRITLWTTEAGEVRGAEAG